MGSFLSNVFGSNKDSNDIKIKNRKLEEEIIYLKNEIDRLVSIIVSFNHSTSEERTESLSIPSEHRLSQEVQKVVQNHLENSLNDSSDNWKLISSGKNNVKIYRREFIDNDIVCDTIKAIFTVKGVTGHELCQNFWNSGSRHEYGVIKKREVFNDLNSTDTIIVHELLNKHWAADQRDICFWSHIRNFDSKDVSSWIVANYSTEHDQAPITSPIVRAKINIALIGKTKLGNDTTKNSCTRDNLTCEVTYVAYINPGGHVPVAILRKVFENEYANFVTSFSKFVQEQTAGKQILF